MMWICVWSSGNPIYNSQHPELPVIHYSFSKLHCLQFRWWNVRFSASHAAASSDDAKTARNGLFLNSFSTHYENNKRLLTQIPFRFRRRKKKANHNSSVTQSPIARPSPTREISVVFPLLCVYWSKWYATFRTMEFQLMTCPLDTSLRFNLFALP